MSHITPKQAAMELRSYSLAELAYLYNVCDRTFKKWIKPFLTEIGERRGRFYTINQVQIIFEKLGAPPVIMLSQDSLKDKTLHNSEKSGTIRHN